MYIHGEIPAFEWDEDKRIANIRKHGIDFLDMANLFKHPILEKIDNREDYGEERIIALGTTGGAVFRIVFTLRGTGVRMISAMKANKHEQDLYYRSIYS